MRRSATAGIALAGLAAPVAGAQEPATTAAPSATATPEIVIPTGPTGPKPTVAPTATPVKGAMWPRPEPTVAPQRDEQRAHERAKRRARQENDTEDRETRGRKRPRKPDGVPQPPSNWEMLPATRVSAAALDAFRIPPFLLPIYQAAGIQYGVRWEVLAAINEIETNNGLNMNVSSAGALGWMQFMPSSWRAYGVDANGDGLRDPYNPVDAIFAAARYLKAAGAATDIRAAVFSYNHADWYVNDVLRRAQEIAALPTPLVGALTGLAQGRLPIAAPMRTVKGRPGDRFALLRTRSGAAAIAVADGRVTRIGHNQRLGNYLELQDVYGNLFTYSHLGTVAKTHPVPRRAEDPKLPTVPTDDPAPTEPATTADSSLEDRQSLPKATRTSVRNVLRPRKERLFARPGRKQARKHGGFVQLAEAGYRPLEGATLKLNQRDYDARALRKGSRVLAGSIVGRVGDGADPRMRFEIRPAGKGAPRIQPQPILDGWRLLQSTSVYRTAKGGALPTLGQALLLGKPALQRMVLADPRIAIYDCGRRDIRIGAIDRRVLATLEFLASSGMNPTVSSLQCGHGFLTTSGNVSEHSSGSAVDIAAINSTPILGNQGPGSVTDDAVRALLTLQGPMAPHQIITLMDYEGFPAAFGMGDHADHIHVGFRPEATDRGASVGGAPTLAAGTWPKLVRRLASIEQPRVATRPSRYALRVTP